MTHAALSVLIRCVHPYSTPHPFLISAIRNRRIPPLPKGDSQALSSVIKSMLNLNVSPLHGPSPPPDNEPALQSPHHSNNGNPSSASAPLRTLRRKNCMKLCQRVPV